MPRLLDETDVAILASFDLHAPMPVGPGDDRDDGAFHGRHHIEPRGTANFARQFALALEGGCQEGDPGKISAYGECLWADSDCDTFIGTTSTSRGSVLGGTGKWKGVIGSGTYQHVSSSKLANASSRVIASAFAASADATPSRLTWERCFVLQLFWRLHRYPPIPALPQPLHAQSALSETFETRNMDISQPA